MSDRVCVGSKCTTKGFNFFVVTEYDEEAPCTNIIGLGPPRDKEDNLIIALYDQGEIDKKLVTMYIDRDESSNSSRIDIGVLNNDYINGEWYTHDTQKTKFTANVYMSAIQLSSLSFNDTAFISKSTLVYPDLN